MGSFGDNLRRERELRGIELRDIAEATKISVRFLQALEQDRVDVLPGGIFPRAFVRQYARHLGLDPERLVAEFLYASRGETVEKRPKVRPRAAPDLRWVLASLLILGAVAVGFRREILDLVTGLRAEAPPAEEPAPARADVPFPEDRVYPPPTPAPRVVAEHEGLVLALEARQDTWVGAQVDGMKVLDRVLKQGETQTLEAKRDIVLSVGNAAGLGFTLNGRPGASLGGQGEVRRNIVITKESMASLIGDAPAAPAPRPN